MEIEQKLLEKTQWVTNGRKQVPDLIVIHWIGPYPAQSVYDPRKWWESDPAYHSAHYVVKDWKILSCLPDDLCAYHAGDSRNLHSIGIEVIPKNKEGEFSAETVESLKWLCEHLKAKWDIKGIERHYDGAQKKDCPRYYCPQTHGDGRWAELKEKIDG
jgi:N-acetylmuramoyl-L-alanine amidase CwlA